MIFIKMLHVHIDEGYFVENTHKRANQCKFLIKMAWS